MTRVTLDDVAGAVESVGLDTPTSTGRHRRAFRFAIPSPGAPQQIQISEDSALGLRFATRSFDASAADAPEVAELASGAAGLIVRLPNARRIHRVRLTSAEAGDRVAAFRFDGEAVSDAPVKVATHGSSGATLDVTDSQVILRRRRGSSDLALTPGAIADLILAAPPQNPRVGFRIAGDPTATAFLPPEISDEGQPNFPTTVSCGPAFAASLSAAIARFAAVGPLPDPVMVDLVVEADAPCRVTITALDLGFVLQRTHLPGHVTKAVLRFSGDRRETHELPLVGPAGITVLSAAVRLTPPAGAGPTDLVRSGRVILGPDPAHASDTGIGVGGGLIVATRRELAVADVVTAADITAAALDDDGAEMLVQLLAEHNGQPGELLGKSAPITLRVGRPVPITAKFDPPAVVPAGPIWIGLRCRGARALVLLVPDPAAEVVVGDGTSWSTFAATTGLGGAARLRGPARDATAAPAATTVSVSIGAEPVPLSRDGNDLLADLAATSIGLPSGPFSVSVRSTISGPVTAGPLVLQYVPVA